MDEKIKAQCDKLKYNVLEESKPARSKFLNTVSGIVGIVDIATFEKEKFKEAIGQDLRKRKEGYDYYMSEIKEAAEKFVVGHNNNA